MKLPLPKLFPKKGTSSDYLLALLLRDEKVSAVIVEKLEGKMKVIGQHTEYFTTALENADSNELLEILDKTISRAEETLPPDIETKDTVFGVKDEWVEEKKIKKEHLLKLKKVSESLDLTPVGFLVISEAVARLIQEEEGAPLSAIVAEIEKDSVNLVLFRGGKVLDSKKGNIEESPMHTVDTLLKHFTVEVLPSRIILSQGGKEDALVQKFITHQWSKSLPFLHVPQISVLPETFDARSIVFGAATQMGLEILGEEIEKGASEIKTYEQGEKIAHAATGDETIASTKPSSDETPDVVKDDIAETDDTPTIDEGDKDEAAVLENEPEGEQKETMLTTDNFGFVSDEDIEKVRMRHVHEEKAEQSAPHRTPMHVVQESNDTDDEVESSNTKQSPLSLLQEKAVALLAMAKFVPGIAKKGLGVASVVKGNKLLLIPVALLIGIVIFGVFYITTVKATVTLNLKPRVVEERQEVTFSPDLVNDFSKQTLQASAVTSTLEGTATTNATGKKDIGEKAKGSVTLFNNNETRRQLAAGTTITSSNNLEYVLDKEVTIASQSGDFFTGTKPGTAQATVTAKNIGPDYNLPSNTRFSVSGASNVVARNDSAFSGGSKKQVTVVAKKDTDKLIADLPKSLESKVASDLESKVDSDTALLPGFTDISVVSRKFDKEVDSEAKTVTLRGRVTFEALTYKKKDLQDLASAALKREYAQNLRISDKGVTAEVVEADTDEDNEVTASVLIKANLLPTLNTEDIKKQLTGKSAQEVEELLGRLPQVSSSEVKFSLPIPFIPKFMPRNNKNIRVEIKEDA